MSQIIDDTKSVQSQSSSKQMDQSDRYARAIVRTMQQPILILTPNLKVEFANPAFYRAFQVPDSETIGGSLYQLGNGQWDIPDLRRVLDQVSGTQKKVENYRVEHSFERIGRRILLLNAIRLEQADTAGEERILLAFSDITEPERHRFEMDARKEFAEKTLDAVWDAFLTLSWDLQVKSANQNFYRMFQVDPQQTEGRLVYELGNGQWNIPRLRELLEQILPESNSIDSFEVEHDFEEIGHRVMLLNARPIDHYEWILLAIQDVTEQRRKESEQKLLMGEMQHRVKNVLMNVRALAHQTRRRTHSLDEFSESFEGRLETLAGTQDLLIRNNANQVQLADLIRLELQALGTEEGPKLHLDGPPLELSTRVSHPMAMTLHELATNAAKYGALTADEGSITISWSTEQENERCHLRLQWREHGVPLTGQPSRKGFGTELIERSLPYLFGGSSRLFFHSDGLECRIEFFLPKKE